MLWMPAAPLVWPAIYSMDPVALDTRTYNITCICILLSVLGLIPIELKRNMKDFSLDMKILLKEVPRDSES